MDYKYKEKRDECNHVVVVQYITPGATASSSSSSSSSTDTTIYLTAADSTTHAITLVKRQGVYTLEVNQTPE